MSKWEMVKLGTVVNINMGQSPDSSTYNQERRGLPFFQGNADFGTRYPTVRCFCTKPTKLANMNDVLISVRAPIGALNIANKPCCIGRGLAAISKIDQVSDCLYIYYFLRSKNVELKSKGTGSTFKAINKKILNDLVIPLPPLEVQQKIAQTLDAAAELLALRKQQLAALDKLIKSVFYEMFGDPVTNEKGWSLIFVQDVYTIIDGDRGVNYPKQNDFYEDGYCLFLNTGNVTKDGFKFGDLKFISEEKDKELRKGKLERGDIILTTRGTVGNIAYYNEGIAFNVVRINSGMVILRNHCKEIQPLYFCELFKNKEMGRRISSFLSGTAQPQLPITNLKKIRFPLPPLSLQNQFAAIVTKIEEQKALVQKAIDESQYLFDSLMNEYFN